VTEYKARSAEQRCAKMTMFSAADLMRIDEIRKSKPQCSRVARELGMLFEELNAPDLALAEWRKAICNAGWLAQEDGQLCGHA